MKTRMFINLSRAMRITTLIALASFLTLLASAQPAHAAGVVSVCDEAHLTAAMTGGGTVTFTCSGTITLTSTIAIYSNTTLDGAGQKVTISGNNAVRVFSVARGVTFNLLNLTVANGNDSTGGGIANFEGILNVTNSTFTGNRSPTDGAAIINLAGTVSITNSTFFGNVVEGSGGAITNRDGRVSSVGGPITITNSTFSGNSIAIENIYGTTTLRNTIIANSSIQNCSRSIVDGGGNLQYGGYNPPPPLPPVCGATIPVADPMLGALSDNGGSTMTMPLLPGSPAINAAVAANCPTTDQRGYGRNGACDIGAFEYNGIPPQPTDATAPTITLTTPAQGATYLLGQAVTANYTCQDEAGGSGLASCVGTVANGANIDTGSVGSKTFTVNARDNAGNPRTHAVTYRVAYNFVGLTSPVDNPPTMNIAKAGQAIPLKWRLLNASGAPVTNLSSTVVKVTAIGLSCAAGTTTDQIEEYAAGESGLQNLGNGYYQWNWKSPKTYANSCKTLKLDLGEGTGNEHTALFQFK
ncbi:MAG: PxKF domain-containing protein [Chloroflexi bacterium]|nr:PxKF domain-containing protein [Chloroflexota bacterium]